MTISTEVTTVVCVMAIGLVVAILCIFYVIADSK
jgi:hypothetical protein